MGQFGVFDNNNLSNGFNNNSASFRDPFANSQMPFNNVQQPFGNQSSFNNAQQPFISQPSFGIGNNNNNSNSNPSFDLYSENLSYGGPSAFSNQGSSSFLSNANSFQPIGGGALSSVASMPAAAAFDPFNGSSGALGGAGGGSSFSLGQASKDKKGGRKYVSAANRKS